MPHVPAKDGTSLHVKDMGTGRPVVLIHGWPLTGDMWEHQTLALVEAGYRVITYDRRGFGLSGHPINTFDCVDAWGRTDFRPDLPSFTVPTLVIHGSADAMVPAEISGKKAAETIPGATYIEYEGAPHGLFVTHAERVNEDLLKFLAS